MEYLRIRRRILTARKGLKLLKLKRQALILEFFKLRQTATALREDLRRNLLKGYESVHTAEMLTGQLRLEYEAMRIPRVAKLRLRTRNVMGVKIPELKSSEQPAGSDSRYLLELPPAIHETIRTFRDLHKLVIEVAEKETALRKLLLEIEKTKRRSNAIESVLIPRLERSARYIKFVFDEMERESFIRLKTVKRKMAQRNEEIATA
jgi:V/A-type H+-transporting ATPase subunit D